MKTTTMAAIALAAAGVSGATYYYMSAGPDGGAAMTTVQVSRGSVVREVQASGTLEAVTTVQVGSQVSGVIQALNADFNSIVRKGQVIATLDPSLFQTQIEQARATVVRLTADLERLRVQVDSARSTLRRTTELAARQLVSSSDLEAATVQVRTAEAQLKSAEAQVTQAEASLHQAELSLSHTVIRAPIDGIVISRNVDVGQTVAASMSAPTLFVIAEDLTRMQANASIDESDVGAIRPGQPVRFTVDAYPGEEFSGQVAQVRLQASVVQNVVTYTTMIDVPNRDLKLKPGMTANVVVETDRRDNVLRIPVQALRFKPSAEALASLGVQMAEPVVPIARTAPPGAAAGGGVQRAVLRTGGAVDLDGARDAAPGVRQASLNTPVASATSKGTVWVADGQILTPVRVTLGIADGVYVELVGGELEDGTEVVTRVSLPSSATAASTAGSSPLLPSRPPGPPR